jgi:hypothetical protein
VPHAIAWRGHNPHQASPEHLVQSYPSLNAHTVGYGPFWENGIPEHLLGKSHNLLSINAFKVQDVDFELSSMPLVA